MTDLECMEVRGRFCRKLSTSASAKLNRPLWLLRGSNMLCGRRLSPPDPSNADRLRYTWMYSGCHQKISNNLPVTSSVVECFQHLLILVTQVEFTKSSFSSSRLNFWVWRKHEKKKNKVSLCFMNLEAAIVVSIPILTGSCICHLLVRWDRWKVFDINIFHLQKISLAISC